MGILPFATIRPSERGVIERLGKFHAYKEPGFTWLIPIVDNIIKVDVTEQIMEVDGQEIITKDKLNAKVKAQVYFKVRADEKSVFASQYNVENYFIQIVSLAQTTLRSIIGTMDLMDANSDRNKINSDLATALDKQTEKWGIEIVRTELKEIRPPEEVQVSMNKVVEASNVKTAAVDLATAAATKADGERQALVKIAEAQRQSEILKAEGQAKAIELVAVANAKQTQVESEAASKYFKDNAVELKKLQVARDSLMNNTKIIVSKDGNLVNVIGDTTGVVPLKEAKR